MHPITRRNQVSINISIFIFLSRILRLSGMEVGFNIEGKVDTFKRYIYIHGCPDSHAMQIPSSHGCIKMRNTDMIDLFDKASVGDVVTIS